MPTERPLLIVVTGPPGSGKTMLAEALARRVCCPRLGRDELKEGLGVTRGATHAQLPADTNAMLYDAYFELIDGYVDRGITLVTEAAFQHERWAPKLSALRERCRLRIVRCVVDLDLARERTRLRAQADPRRERFHRSYASDDDAGATPQRFAALAIDAPTLDVDTSQGYRPSLEVISAFALSGVIDERIGGGAPSAAP